MTHDKKQNVAHSVFERLLSQAKRKKEDFNLLLFRYGVERLLYRLSVSPYSDRFILKGASMFLVWKGQNYRVTKDVDLLGSGPTDTENITIVFKHLCQSVIEHETMDGIKFISDTVRAVPIREEEAYDGIRVTLTAILHKARIPLQVDIGFGDAVTPKPDWIEFPTLLDGPPPRLFAYPIYTMAAEKTEAIIRLGLVNSRMKDFYDLLLMSHLFEFDGRILSDAIRNTFERRRTPLPSGQPMAFTDEFLKDEQKQVQWRAFVRKSRPEDISEDLKSVIERVAEFLMPVIESVREKKPFEPLWPPGGPWT